MARTALYRHFDAADRLIYVGISDCLSARDKQHAVTAHWHGSVKRTETTWHADRRAALVAEWEAIRDESPIYNVRRAPPAFLIPATEKREHKQEALGKYFAQQKGQQAAVAARVGVSPSYISDLLCGRRVPSLDVALRIYAATDGAVPLRSWPNLAAIADAVAAEDAATKQEAA